MHWVVGILVYLTTLTSLLRYGHVAQLSTLATFVGRSGRPFVDGRVRGGARVDASSCNILHTGLCLCGVVAGFLAFLLLNNPPCRSKRR